MYSLRVIKIVDIRVEIVFSKHEHPSERSCSANNLFFAIKIEVFLYYLILVPCVLCYLRISCFFDLKGAIS